MRYLALACDYDGTVATHGAVGDHVLHALDRVASSGRHLVLVTGRELDDLLRVFPGVGRFDRVVAENGAVVYNPSTGERAVLCEPPSDAFIGALKARGVDPLSRGLAIVSTHTPNETAVLEVIRELGLELHVVFNKGAVMVLPSGVNKASGLAVCLREIGLSPHNVVGVGDAENDHAFLELCECSVAVRNALPAVKERCDLVTHKERGDGVIELADRLCADDLDGVSRRGDRDR